MRRSEAGMWSVEAQRREERRAQARLAGGLRQLDEARLYQLKTLTREQWRIHRDLGAIRGGNPWKKTTEGQGTRPWDQDFYRPTQSCWRSPLPIIPQARRGPEKHRSQKLKSGGVDDSSAALQARVREFMGGGGESRVEGSGAPLCLPDLKAQTATRPSAAAQGEDESEAGKKTDKERGKLQWEGEKRSLSPPPVTETLAPDIRLRTVHTLPSFSQALAEARKARYIRHRVRPVWEKELSVAEIFARPAKDAKPH